MDSSCIGVALLVYEMVCVTENANQEALSLLLLLYFVTSSACSIVIVASISKSRGDDSQKSTREIWDHNGCGASNNRREHPPAERS
mmetsp:Transcript_14128/g.32560  ORF Transcript_14128/g.32560 Transcript_14128/m.32560 type:complete len:86 (+) Transcript_14128:192-449(+)